MFMNGQCGQRTCNLFERTMVLHHDYMDAISCYMLLKKTAWDSPAAMLFRMSINYILHSLQIHYGSTLH